MDLNDTDRRIYKYLQDYEASHSVAPAPSYREIIDACGLSSTALVRKSLRHLKEAGLIEWFPGIARSIRVLPQAEASAVVSRHSQREGWV